MNPSRNLWPHGIILTFALFICGTVGLVIMACGQKADLVSPDYYEKEIRFQSHLDSAARSQNLEASVSYKPDARQIRIELPKTVSVKKPMGQVTLYRPSAATLDRHISLNPGAQGVQTIDAAALEPGLWKVRITWDSDGKEYFLERSLTVK